MKVKQHTTLAQVHLGTHGYKVQITNGGKVKHANFNFTGDEKTVFVDGVNYPRNIYSNRKHYVVPYSVVAQTLIQM